MATTPKTLDSGLMDVTTATMATVPAGKAWVGITIMLYNVDADDYKDVYLAVYTDAATRGIAKLRLDADGGNAVVRITSLSESELIKGNATDNSSVTYVITGGEQDA